MDRSFACAWHDFNYYYGVLGGVSLCCKAGVASALARMEQTHCKGSLDYYIETLIMHIVTTSRLPGGLNR